MSIHTQVKITHWLLLAVTLAFAFLRFSEPAADPDLWGHVLYGQRTLSGGEIEYTEPFSWTAEGHRWINHEMLAELTMGAAHQIGGSSALFWLMLTLSFGAFLLAIYLGKKGLTFSIVAWIIGLLICREAAIGFAMRPQLFSAIYFVLFLGGLIQLLKGAPWPTFLLPILLCLWINTHGAALLALVLLLVTVASTTLGLLITPLIPQALKPYLTFESLSKQQWRNLLLCTVLSWLAVGITPYGYDLLVWLIDSVRYVRPEITEWNPTPISFEHILFFVSFPIFGLLACINRHTKRPWEIGVLTVLFIAAFRHERHIALYSLAYIVIAPRYIDAFLQTDTIKAWAKQHIRLNSAKLIGLNIILALAALTFLWQGLSPKIKDRFQMQIPKEEYPVAAFQFLQQHELSGNLVVNFNWAQMAIWELPTSKVSFDGRLDTCYPRELIEAHWALYYKGVLPTEAFDFDQTDLVIIPSGLALNDTLRDLTNWQLIYQDPLAKIYLNQATKPDWQQATTYRKSDAIWGNVPFPDTIAANASL